MAQYEIQTVTLSSGRTVPAALFVCPHCTKLDMKNLRVNTSVEPWEAKCGCGGEFTIDTREN